MLKKFAKIASDWAIFVEILCPSLKLNLDVKGAHL
jgi:hypothetical protein